MQNYQYLLVDSLVIGQFFACINDKSNQGTVGCFKLLLQVRLIEAPGFPDESFNAVAVDCLFKVTAAGAETGLETGVL